uniref:Uncharacterized protein n=1 Tax=Peronospora matthiolae TaxID=2874970 RepID=A0AAV1UPZ7_9STRA
MASRRIMKVRGWLGLAVSGEQWQRNEELGMRMRCGEILLVGGVSMTLQSSVA